MPTERAQESGRTIVAEPAWAGPAVLIGFPLVGAALRKHGYTWLPDGDPYAAEFRRWRLEPGPRRPRYGRPPRIPSHNPVNMRIRPAR
ncbi:MAG TPA: hypothetical protein VHG10_01095 [Glycomyces sp.]|nr:hypothetical protein [Glycomyces sp.]